MKELRILDYGGTLFVGSPRAYNRINTLFQTLSSIINKSIHDEYKIIQENSRYENPPFLIASIY